MPIPRELFAYKQWVLWRTAEVDGHRTKVPISPWSGKPAACNKPQTWGTYRHVCYSLHRFRCDGVGFVFTGDDPFCGIDIDHCRAADGIIAPGAQALIERIGSYAELSPSGTGVHILLQGALAGRGRRSGSVEVYDSSRYFTMTGRHVAGTPTQIQERQQALEQLTRELFSPYPVRTTIRTGSALVNLSDPELIDRASDARNGARFKRLWAGDTSDYANDHSRADLALCRMLAFWCRGEADRMDKLFRQSGLMREKWDRRTGDLSYGALTILAALGRAE
ncbi:MAG TPA: hypothetical protein VH351_15475 [Bryobacteraceae bacterium]|jgi:primase-polymerase (primpol)-like protein|nr:hypothetical protein [Bryobacteraceae bacterium]